MKLNPCTAIVDVDGTVCGGEGYYADWRGSVNCTLCNARNGADHQHESVAITLWNLNNPLAEEGGTP